MLTSISPLGERARHNRWAVTIAWYLVASTLTAAAVGALLGGLGGVVDLSLTARVATLAVVAAGAAAADGLGLRLPGPRRQVDEDWLGRYRGWVYGAGFGAQLGGAVATIVTTATIWATLAAELLAGSAGGGALIGATFGLLRAVPILSGAGVSDFAQLQERHRRLVGWGARAGQLTVAGAAAVALGLALAAWRGLS